MSDIAIRADNLSKRYRLGLQESAPDSLACHLLSWVRSPWKNYQRLRKLSTFDEDEKATDVLWALRDVSFEVKRGEVIGFIGRNGAGKSTLLKIVSRITDPTRGHLDIFGRVSSLLEVGTGFHPELTGRENIYLNGTILGMKKREIDRKFDAIVDFAGMGPFIDTPVKRYSSGMAVRLAFAVAANLEPDVLIVDEVLAVGDAQFQQKSLGKMQEVARTEGRTVLFVSHNMAAVENLCHRVVVMEKGEIVMVGETRSAIREYLRKNNAHASLDLHKVRRRGSGRFRFTHFFLSDEEGNKVEFAQSGRPITLNVGYQIRWMEEADFVDVGFGIHGAADEPLVTVYASQVGREFQRLSPVGEIRCRIPRLPVRPGRYLIHAIGYMNDDEADYPLDPIATFDVEDGDFHGLGKTAKNRGNATVLIDTEWNAGAVTVTSAG